MTYLPLPQNQRRDDATFPKMEFSYDDETKTGPV